MAKISFKKASQAVVAISSTTIYHYSRADYKNWIDADKDCQNTKQ